MAQTTAPVYDLTCPSPVTLKEISAIALVAELWREEIVTWDSCKLKDDIALKKMIPNVPSLIYNLVLEYSYKFKLSIKIFFRSKLDHGIWIGSFFDFHSKSCSKYFGSVDSFNDFVWDQNGALHYVRTVKQMIRCDQLTDLEKFVLAYKFCIEDDIRRIWPLVRCRLHLTQIRFDERPLLFYWICLLSNELHNLPNPHDVPIDELMLNNCSDGCFYSFEYFWNRTPYERRSKATIWMSLKDPGSFAKFILQRLNDFELNAFLAERGVDFMISLVLNEEIYHVFPAWIYIRNKMNKSQFVRFIEILLEKETSRFTVHKRLKSMDIINIFCEIWKNSPDNLKRCALINDVLSNEELFIRKERGPSEPREMRILITILLDASFEQRHKFWCKNWRNLINGARVEDLLRVMKLCFRGESDISSFKKQYMSEYENIGPYCIELLHKGCFEELCKFLFFCCSDEQKVRELKQQLLRSNFLGENSILCNKLISCKYTELNAFVEDAFEDVDLRIEFKNQLVSFIRDGSFDCVMQFCEIFAPEEPVVSDLKQRLLGEVKELLVSGKFWITDKFLNFLLGNEDEIRKFKQSLPVDDIFCKMISQIRLKNPYQNFDGSWETYLDTHPVWLDDFLEWHSNNERVITFLNWYFNNNAEEIRKIKERHSDRLTVFDKLISMSSR
ncbi:uncharacterized protein LOC135848075 [Planococcus citri]|uniref:uncharacterized protein LOC135848075 n=1 Tax=Planococcus citri TaxID=170843 RepID=UPI0031F9097B